MHLCMTSFHLYFEDDYIFHDRSMRSAKSSLFALISSNSYFILEYSVGRMLKD